MVEITTHQAIVRPQTQTETPGGVMGNPSQGAATPAFLLFAQPMSTEEAYRQYGVELKGAYIIMADLAYAQYFAPNAVVALTPNSGLAPFELICSGNPTVYDAGDDADHIEQLCYDPQFQP